MEECFSLESMDKDEWKVEETSLEKTGEKTWSSDPERKFVFYKDSKGRIWYKTMIRTKYGWVSQEQFVFGKKLQKRRPV